MEIRDSANGKRDCNYAIYVYDNLSLLNLRNFSSIFSKTLEYSKIR